MTVPAALYDGQYAALADTNAAGTIAHKSILTPQPVTLLTSAARTVQTQATDQINVGGKGIIVIMRVTVAAGAGGLTLTVQGKDPISGIYYKVSPAPAAVIATGTFVYQVYPGLGAIVGDVTQNTNGLLPSIWTILVTVGGVQSYTYSVSGIVIP